MPAAVPAPGSPLSVAASAGSRDPQKKVVEEWPTILELERTCSSLAAFCLQRFRQAG
jgi:hypothetical protein